MWIEDYIRNYQSDPQKYSGKNILQVKDDYFLFENLNEKSRKLNKGRKKQFTIIEGIKMFNIINSNNNNNMNKPNFWEKICN